jgi:HK97 gp10 family phage protein
MGAEIEISGLNELMANLAKAGANVNRAASIALKAAAEPIADDMRKLVHVSSESHRHIRDDITISPVKKQGDVQYITIGPGPETRWRARFLEFGTSGSGKHKATMAFPFIQPAGEKNKDTVPAIIAKVLGGAAKT